MRLPRCVVVITGGWNGRNEGERAGKGSPCYVIGSLSHWMSSRVDGMVVSGGRCHFICGKSCGVAWQVQEQVDEKII